jgi:uncharacterized membrane protein
VLSIAVVVTGIAMIWLWPGSLEPAQLPDEQRLSGQVLQVEPAACPALPSEAGSSGALAPVRDCGNVFVRMRDGPNPGEVVVTDVPGGVGAPQVAAGDEVVVLYLPQTLGGRQYSIIDHQRGSRLWLFVAAFALAVIGFGRLRGLTALAGLGVTFAVLLLFVIPAILAGEPPLLVAIVGSAAIMLVVLYLTHGVNVPTSMALLGTLVAMVVTGALSALTTTFMKLTGIANEEAAFLTVINRDVDMRGLLLAGILIGALGVLDDVAVTQAYTVTELSQANPDMGPGALYRSASRVGRAHIASVINTIVLAYAGTSLPLLLLIAAGGRPLGQLLNSELLVQEVVRSGVGTIGLITAVPITTALASFAVRRVGAVTRPPRQRRRVDPLERQWGLDETDPTGPQARW